MNLCLLQASVEEGLALGSVKCVTHVSLVALCFDRIATQFRMNRYCLFHLYLIYLKQWEGKV